MTRPHLYILDDDGNPVPVDTGDSWGDLFAPEKHRSAVLAWAAWIEKANKVVKQTTIGPYWVSTVFLGVDYGWDPGPPIIYETMVFLNGDWHDLDCRRYSTRAEAEAGHQTTCDLVTLELEKVKP